jgi:N-acetylglutamate synthase-like GNAT family acetyltransferase
MIIRNAVIDDAEIIAENNKSLALESENIILKYETVLKGVKKLITDKNKGFYIIAEKNNKIIGQIMITFEWSDWKNKNIWWLQSVYVNKFCRQKGIFKELFNNIKRRASNQNIDTLRLYVHSNNKNAKKVYHQIKMIEVPYNIFQMKLKS